MALHIRLNVSIYEQRTNEESCKLGEGVATGPAAARHSAYTTLFHLVRTHAPLAALTTIRAKGDTAGHDLCGQVDTAPVPSPSPRG